MELDRLPSIIRNTSFEENGLVREEDRFLVPAYVGSQFGFSYYGRKDLEDFYKKLNKINVLALCPFAACNEYLDMSKINNKMSLDKHIAFWDNFNKTIGAVNYETLMPHSKFMIALFDGSHASDDGLCSEVSHFAKNHGPVIGIRSDFRMGENVASNINAAVRYFIDKGHFKGKYFSGFNAYDEALNSIEGLAAEIIESANARNL